MGVVKAMIGFGRSKSESEAGAERTRAQFVEDATLEEGLRHVLSTIDNLTDLETRLAAMEAGLAGNSAAKQPPLPEAEGLGFDGSIPRLMEASLLIGAMTRRMHLRVNQMETALGLRVEPANDAAINLLSPAALKHTPDPITDQADVDCEDVFQFAESA